MFPNQMLVLYGVTTVLAPFQNIFIALISSPAPFCDLFLSSSLHQKIFGYKIFFIFVYKDLSIYLKQVPRDGERWAFHPLVHSLDGCNSRDCSSPKQEPGTSSASPIWVAGFPNAWDISCCFSQAMSGELDPKWTRQDVNWYPWGTTVSEAAALLAIQQYQPVPATIGIFSVTSH